MEPQKSKSLTTSVPSISIKFHANDEKIEEFSISEGDTPATEEKSSKEFKKSPRNSFSDSGENDSSPLKFLPKLGGGKRSTSVDVSPHHLESSPSPDPWRFFTDIKGKITKNVEERLADLKREKEGSPSHKLKNDTKKQQETKDNKEKNNKEKDKEFKDTKESPSVSDSDDISESSISKTCEVISTTEGVEMSSEDDTPIDKHKISSSKIIQRFRFLRSKTPTRDHKDHKDQKEISVTKEGSVGINHLSKIYNINTERVEQALPEDTEDVDCGVEAMEDVGDMTLSGDKQDNELKHPTTDTIINAVSNKIDNIEISDEKILNVKEVTGHDIRESFTDLKKTDKKRVMTVFAPTGFVDLRLAVTNNKGGHSRNYTPWIVLVSSMILYLLLHSFSPYFAGILIGLTLSSTAFYVYVKFYALDVVNVGTNTTHSSTPLGYRIMEIPAIKEHQPLVKYEGWVNEFPESYDPSNYHVSQTQSVFLRIQGNLLRISHSKNRIPKRAMWNEAEIKATLTHHRIYNLTDAKVSLLPEGLAKIRHWSKKYPICVTLSGEQMNFDPAVLKTELEIEKPIEKKKTPKLKNKFGFRKHEYPELAQRFSKLTQDDLDLDLDSDSRESSPSPEDVDIDESTTTTNPDEAEQNDASSDYVEIPQAEMMIFGHHVTDYAPLDLPEKQVQLYLFGRTDREKEDWFRRLTAATHYSTTSACKDSPERDREIPLEKVTLASQLEAEYVKYMSVFNKPSRKKSTSAKEDPDKSEIEKDDAGDTVDKSELTLWFNAIVGRVLFDCMRDPKFTVKVKERIQKKLATIKLPYFIEEILITELSLGKTPPFIMKTSKPIIDERGLWIDLDINYEGLVVLTLQTKLNLMKLKNPHLNEKPCNEIRSAIYHSDVDDSAESSTDEEITELPVDKKETERHGGSKKFIKMVDKIAESKFFQAATENRYIKKAMEGVSNTHLRLTVELKALNGTMVLNIPPPPSDRIWIGFRPVPELIVSGRPIVGERNVNYGMVTSWIEKKMLQEFQKVMVIPNMEDFLVPVMDQTLPQ